MKHPSSIPTVLLTVTGRLLLLAALAFLLASPVAAVRLRNVPTPVTQPDGRLVEILTTGDEFEQYLHDAAGYTIVRDPKTRWYVYAEAGLDGLRPTADIVGQADPAKAGLTPGARPLEAQVLSKRQAAGQALREQRDARRCQQRQEQDQPG